MFEKNAILILLIFISTSYLYGEDNQNFFNFHDTSTVELTDGLPDGLPEQIVNGTVSVISGEYVDHCVDITILGP